MLKMSPRKLSAQSIIQYVYCSSSALAFLIARLDDNNPQFLIFSHIKSAHFKVSDIRLEIRGTEGGFEGEHTFLRPVCQIQHQSIVSPVMFHTPSLLLVALPPDLRLPLSASYKAVRNLVVLQEIQMCPCKKLSYSIVFRSSKITEY